MEHYFLHHFRQNRRQSNIFLPNAGSGAGLWSTNSFSSMDQLLLSKQLSVGSLDFNSWVQAAEHIDGLPKGGC